MVVNFTTKPYQEMITVFEKTLVRTPVTKTVNVMTGSELLSEGSNENIKGAFFRREDAVTQEQIALIQEADAILKVIPSVTINFNDKITYEGEVYRIKQPVVTRRLGTVEFYKLARLFKDE